MKKKIPVIVLAVLLLGLLFCLADHHAYTEGTKTISFRREGLVFSITTFDGVAEGEPFQPCLGHAWCSLENFTGHSVALGGTTLSDGELLTFSAWAVSGHAGVLFNIEPNYIRLEGRYAGRRSLSMNIEEDDLKTIDRYIAEHDTWTPMTNCSTWSLGLWNALAEEEYQLPSQILLYTPDRVKKAMTEFDCVEINQDFSRAGGGFFYRDGVRVEAELCK